MVETFDPNKGNTPGVIPILRLGFRPFFLCAGLFAMLSMAQWGLIYHGLYSLDTGKLTPYQWHAHEMIFGYGLAVIAGFLLTSVRNWTGQPTPVGRSLGVLVLFWVLARLGFAWGGSGIILAILCNLFFMMGFLWSIVSRIFRVKQWRQLGIVGIVLLLILAEAGFFVGVMERRYWFISGAIYAAFYLMVLLILVVSRRVVPFFIERGVGYPCQLKQSGFLDGVVVVGFVIYALAELTGVDSLIAGVAAAVVFVAQTVRLINWHTAGIWKKPLLWSLYLALVFIDLGLLMAALSCWMVISEYIVLHGFAVGGIGFITLSMMSRVSLGHTGRDIHHPPRSVVIAMLLMILVFAARVVMPPLFPASHSTWIGISQVLWMVAFGLFVVQYLPILLSQRVDGRPG